MSYMEKRIQAERERNIKTINEKFQHFGINQLTKKPYIKYRWDYEVLKNGTIKFTFQVYHNGINKTRVFKSKDPEEFLDKAYFQLLQWEENYNKKLKSEYANKATVNAKNKLQEIENILIHTYNNYNRINFQECYITQKFPQAKPTKPQIRNAPNEPKESDAKYKPKLGLFGRIFGSVKKKRIEKAHKLYEQEQQDWNNKANKIESTNKQLISNYNKLLEEWNKERVLYDKNTEIYNSTLEYSIMNAKNSDQKAVEFLTCIILDNIQLPFEYDSEYDIQYEADTKTILIDYVMPTIDNIPFVKEVKYIKSRDEVEEKHLTDKQKAKIYDTTVYNIMFKVIYELFVSDAEDMYAAIVFNGWVNTIDPKTGLDIKPCIVSIHIKKEDFISLNLSQIEPKKCFKSLKGVGSSQLHSMAPVRPVMMLNKEDSRFVEAYEVTNTIDDTTNLAAMDWQDFEHLIRELFELEFSGNGGEVKITQASRDRGVDAVAFDPDPIRGGKIVIQAKRYTNPVQVSAVRDLYGTVHNEGAIKGILITTSNYGPDAIDFAKDKPLTLLSGSELLYLLSKHGYKAKIDLQEAKKILKAEENA